MSYAPDVITEIPNQCQAIMRGVAMVGDPTNTTYMQTPAGITQAVMSPANTSMVRIEPGTSAGGIRNFKLTRIQRGTENESWTAVTCEATTNSGYISQDVVLDQDPETLSFDIDSITLRKYCDEMLVFERTGDSTGLTTFLTVVEQIIAKMNGIRQKVNKRLAAMIIANAGVNVATGLNTPTTVTVLNGTDGSKFELGFQELIEQFEENELPMRPLAIGAGVFNRFNTSLMFGCCNNGGLDWSAMSDAAVYQYYYDKMVATVSGDPNEFLILSPGAVQLIFANQAILPGRQEGQRHGTTLYGTIPDPYVPGLIYDLAIRELDCGSDGIFNPTWRVYIGLLFDVAFIPDDAFAADDPLYGFNGVLRYVAATT